MILIVLLISFNNFVWDMFKKSSFCKYAGALFGYLVIKANVNSFYRAELLTTVTSPERYINVFAIKSAFNLSAILRLSH